MLKRIVGAHGVPFSRANRRRARTTTQALRESRALGLTRSRVSSPAAVASASGALTSARSSAQSSFGTQRVLAIGAGVIGVAGAALGTSFGLMSKAKHDKADRVCDGSNCSDGDGVQLRSEAISDGDRSTVSFIVGAAGLAGGALLWFTASPAKQEEPTTQVRLGLWSLQLSGHF